MTYQVAAYKKNWRDRVVDLLSIHGKWSWNLHVRETISPNRPWYDWGHRVMGLTGQEFCGNLQPPEVKTLYYKRDYEYLEEDDGFSKPIKDHGWITTTEYKKPWGEVDGWKAFYESDYSIRNGYLDHEGRISVSDINAQEMKLFYRWFLWDRLIKNRWLGIRPLLYYKGLHAAVYRKIPLTCQKVPDKSAQAYDHWFCEVKRPLKEILRGARMQHTGPHKYGMYEWTEGKVADYVGEEPDRYIP